MKYCSTRAKNPKTCSASDAILQGLAPDGGLFMPTEIPQMSAEDLAHYLTLSYAELASEILQKYLDDYTPLDLTADTASAYGPIAFPKGPVQLKMLDTKLYSLELWHGPTCAFKDMALQLTPKLLSRALEKKKEKRTAMVVTATSGDTGKAALEGFRNVPGVKIMVYYPANGTSEIQRLQMVTQEGSNVCVTGVDGNFDDAQSGVKALFASPAMQKLCQDHRVFLTSANSINWGRLVPQIVYYVYAYCHLVRGGALRSGELLDVCVPTGNFGNILAAYLAKRMGLPIGQLVCASNRNHVLADFFQTGVYNRNRPFYTTTSPSMDILISSNLERLLYLICGPEKTAEYMQTLKKEGEFVLEPKDLSRIQKDFTGMWTDEDGTAATIHSVYDVYHYACDPHTAVAMGAALKYRETSDKRETRRMLVVSTASPFKFARPVLTSLVGQAPEDEEKAMQALSDLTCQPIPAPLCNLTTKEVRFADVVDKMAIASALEAFICH